MQHKTPYYNDGRHEIVTLPAGSLPGVLLYRLQSLDVESMNHAEVFGLAGGVSFMFVNDDGKRFIKKISDMSYTLTNSELSNR